MDSEVENLPPWWYHPSKNARWPTDSPSYHICIIIFSSLTLTISSYFIFTIARLLIIDYQHRGLIREGAGAAAAAARCEGEGGRWLLDDIRRATLVHAILAFIISLLAFLGKCSLVFF
jgi:hypothetical protein